MGADLAEFGDDKGGFGKASDPDADAQMAAGTYQEPAGLVTSVLYRLNKPVIAAVRGAAAGVGATMLLPVDFRLAADGTKFTFPFTRRGIVPEGASSWFLPRLVGMGKALDWLISGRLITADEALSSGLVNSLHAAESLMEAAHDLARELVTDVAPISAALTRQLVYRMAWAATPEEMHKLESRLVYDTVRGADAVEGVRWFFERRTPEFPTRVPEGLPDYLPWG